YFTSCTAGQCIFFFFVHTAKETGSVQESADAGRLKAREARPTAAEATGFTNPVVGAAFKRALKKYGTAFRRLTE
ncbi:MAG: hypothetical protein ABI837_18010, partial [Acidobacteriota bacterium]